jgi:hypothetical protein
MEELNVFRAVDATALLIYDHLICNVSVYCFNLALAMIQCNYYARLSRFLEHKIDINILVPIKTPD